MADREKLIECLKYCASTSTTQNNCNGCKRRDFDCGSYHCVYDLMLQAAAALEQQKWIPVTERLPDMHTERYEDSVEPTGYGEYLVSDPVLACGVGKGLCGANMFVVVCNRTRENSTIHWTDYSSFHDVIVTHWMPLPQPPKGE